MRVLGLNISGYLSSAAIVEDGQVLAGACEERFSRIKRDRAFPNAAIRDAMARTGTKPGDLDAVAVGWNPGRNLGRNLGLQGEANRARALYFAYVPNAMAGVLGDPPGSESVQEVLGRRIVWVDHPLAHAASAAFTSPFEHGAVVTIDAFGEEDSLTIGRFAGNRIEVLERVRFPHSIGSFYSYFTEFLGFTADADEYKVMALGAYADQDRGRDLLERIRPLYRMEPRDSGIFYELDLGRFDHYLFHRAHDYGPLAQVLGMPHRHRDDPIDETHFALAWALQAAFEDQVTTVLAHARKVTGETRAALSGGCFMNSVANGKLEGPGRPFDAVHVPPYPDDSGTAVGAALHVALNGRDAPRHALRHNFLGTAVTREGAIAALEHRKIPFTTPANPFHAIARDVAAGDVVGIAFGGMEFGQRALGHRSILGDPRDPGIRKKVNDLVKRREWFRPYAASVLAHRVSEVFDVPDGFRADFMEKVRTVRPEWADRIRGLLHADGSVRLHAVEPDENPELHGILLEFEALTGVPLILNTSFNVAGMPVVRTEADAIGCFHECGMDTLVIEGVRIRKAGARTVDSGSEGAGR